MEEETVSSAAVPQSTQGREWAWDEGEEEFLIVAGLSEEKLKPRDSELCFSSYRW